MSNRTNRMSGWKAMAVAIAAGAAMSGAPAIAATTAISYWKFDEHNTTPGNHTGATDFMVIDSTGNANHLYSYEGDGDGYDYTASASTPPQFAGSNVASVTPDPSAGGVLFHEVANSGNDFNLSGTSFTLEGSFRTGVGGRQDVIFSAQNNFSFLVNVNEGAAGQLRFAVGGGPFPQVNLMNVANGGYNNGQWYSFVATYQENGAGQQDVLTLTTYGTDGQVLETGSALTPAGYDINATNANLGIGNTIFANPFQGQIDEVRISRGLVAEKWQLHNVVVAVDTFDNTHDYIASGVAGTIWDGVVNGTAAASTFATSNSPTTLGDGNLEISYSAAATVGFDSDRANAPFLFRTVKAGYDFDAQLVIESTTSANYSVAALMVRDAADGLTGGAGNAGEDWVSLNYNNFSGTSDSVRSSDNGVVTNPFVAGALQRFLRIVREGDLFSFYTRAVDTDDWALRFALSRPDLTGQVQVGLWYGLFSGGNAGTAQIENFILYIAVPTPAAMPAGLALLWLLTVRRRHTPR